MYTVKDEIYYCTHLKFSKSEKKTKKDISHHQITSTQIVLFVPNV